MADRDKAQAVAQGAANDVRDSLHTFLGRSAWTDPVTNFVAALVAASVTLVVAILSAIFRIASDLVALYLETLASAREQNFEAINKVIVAGMSDTLSIDIDPGDLPTNSGGAGQAARVQKLGAAFHDTMYAVFAAGDTGEIGPGERAARGFTGFGLSYAANAALTAIIPEIESLGFFKEFSQIGEEIGSALGIGRMHRRAIAPLFDNLVAIPFKQELNAKFARELLPVPLLCTLNNAKLLEDEEFTRQMGAHGFSARLQALLLQAHAKALPLPVLELSIAQGVLTKGIAVQALQAQGYTPEAAELLLLSLTMQRQDKLRSSVVQDAFAMARDRHMPDVEFKATMESVGVPADEQTLWTQRLQLYLDHSHKRLSIGEILYLLERNQLTSDDLHKWAIGEGYSEDDAFTLEVWADLKDAEYEKKLKAAADKKAAADAKAKAKADAAAAKAGHSGTP